MSLVLKMQIIFNIIWLVSSSNRTFSIICILLLVFAEKEFGSVQRIYSVGNMVLTTLNRFAKLITLILRLAWDVGLIVCVEYRITAWLMGLSSFFSHLCQDMIKIVRLWWALAILGHFHDIDWRLISFTSCWSVVWICIWTCDSNIYVDYLEANIVIIQIDFFIWRWHSLLCVFLGGVSRFHLCNR